MSYTEIRARLLAMRGQWTRIAKESGVPYSTVKKVATEQRDHRSSTLESLSRYFATNGD